MVFFNDIWKLQQCSYAMAPFEPFGDPIGFGAGTLTFDAWAEGGFVGVKCFEKL